MSVFLSGNDVGLTEVTTYINSSNVIFNVMFFWDAVDRKGIVEDLKIKPDIEDLVYVPGALIWRVDRPAVTRSGVMKMVGTDLYRAMTIRNVNTVRKLAELMASA